MPFDFGGLGLTVCLIPMLAVTREPAVVLSKYPERPVRHRALNGAFYIPNARRRRYVLTPVSSQSPIAMEPDNVGMPSMVAKLVNCLMGRPGRHLVALAPVLPRAQPHTRSPRAAVQAGDDTASRKLPRRRTPDTRRARRPSLPRSIRPRPARSFCAPRHLHCPIRPGGCWLARKRLWRGCHWSNCGLKPLLCVRRGEVGQHRLCRLDEDQPTHLGSCPSE